MNTSAKTRFVAAIASILCTFGIVAAIAGYALPEEGASQVAARVVTDRKG